MANNTMATLVRHMLIIVDSNDIDVVIATAEIEKSSRDALKEISCGVSSL
jgi:hypothetical protein